MVIRVGELRDEFGTLTHMMCCLCFEFIPLEDLYRCEHEARWDSCKPCTAENPLPYCCTPEPANEEQ